MLTLKLKHLFLGSLSLSLFVVTQIHAAAVLNPATEPYNYIAPYALSDTDVSDGTAKAYRPWFENGAWQGDIVEYNISSGGLLSTTVDLSVSPPTTSGSNWSARIQFNTNVAANRTTYWDTGRKIIFSDGSTQKAFRWGNLSGAQQTALGTNTYLEYIRGDQSNEVDKTDGTLRQRFNLLGDIIHANPVYVAAPDTPLPSTILGYSDFKNKNAPDGQADRAGRVYASSNDGMVHAFDAVTGNEVWAYIPSMILNDLDKLAAVPFKHTYFVDGQLNEGDADFGASPLVDWHSLLVGGLGSGGKGLFALDITNANLSSETANSGGDKKILWEIDGTDSDMGYIHGKAQVARLPGNKWRVVTGNGYGSTSGVAKLLIIDKDGNVTEVSTDDSITSNGLSAPTLVDIDNDFDVDYGYAGDLQGNLWKFDFNTSPVTASKLFSAGTNKPITSAPDIRRHPNGGRLVYFGTGSLLSTDDAANTQTQSIYAVWDGAPTGNSILTQTLNTADFTYDPGDGTTATVKVRTASNIAVDWSIHKGWQVDLNISGERLLVTPTIRADRMQFVTHNPPASTHGDAWFLQLNFLNGGSGPSVFLDLNRDEALDADDEANNKIPVGVFLGDGSFSGPRIARVSNNRDTVFINGLFLAYPTVCTLNCSSGFQGGHIDVDTDSPNGGSTASTISDSYCYKDGDRAAGIAVDSSGNSPTTSPVVRPGVGADGFGDKTDGHFHEYDKAHGQVYVDLLNIEPRCNQKSAADSSETNDLAKLNRFTEAKIGNTKSFFVVISNADLSPGSYMTIGNKTWNVVIYQKMVQQAIENWQDSAKGNSASNKFAQYMVDYDGASLLFTIDSIIAAGTFRHAFNDRAIIDGGLLPTKTSCVKDHPYETLGGTQNNVQLSTSDKPTTNRDRWRGGALVTQLIDVNAYTATPSLLRYQKPTDLYRYRTIDGVEVWLKVDSNNDGTYDKIYGGLRADDRLANKKTTDNSIFLYENTLFWHFNGPCYGTASWRASVTGAANSTSTKSFKDTVAALELNLEAETLIYDKMVTDGVDEAKLEKQRQLLKKLQEKIDYIKGGLSSSSVANIGVPTPPTEATPELSPSLGPNFRTGRRTWIDLTP